MTHTPQSLPFSCLGESLLLSYIFKSSFQAPTSCSRFVGVYLKALSDSQRRIFVRYSLLFEFIYPIESYSSIVLFLISTRRISQCRLFTLIGTKRLSGANKPSTKCHLLPVVCQRSVLYSSVYRGRPLECVPAGTYL